jgi:hypothetical protein
MLDQNDKDVIKGLFSDAVKPLYDHVSSTVRGCAENRRDIVLGEIKAHELECQHGRKVQEMSTLLAKANGATEQAKATSAKTIALISVVVGIIVAAANTVTRLVLGH